MCASKKGMSAHQLNPTLNIGYKAAWFLCQSHPRGYAHSITVPDLTGGPTSVVKADETLHRRQGQESRPSHPTPKKAVRALVERDGRARSFHVANVTSETVKPIIAARAEKAFML